MWTIQSEFSGGQQYSAYEQHYLVSTKFSRVIFCFASRPKLKTWVYLDGLRLGQDLRFVQRNSSCYFSNSLFSISWFSKVRSVVLHAKRIESDDHGQNQSCILLSPSVSKLTTYISDSFTTYG